MLLHISGEHELPVMYRVTLQKQWVQILFVMYTAGDRAQCAEAIIRSAIIGPKYYFVNLLAGIITNIPVWSFEDLVSSGYLHSHDS